MVGCLIWKRARGRCVTWARPSGAHLPSVTRGPLAPEPAADKSALPGLMSHRVQALLPVHCPHSTKAIPKHTHKKQEQTNTIKALKAVMEDDKRRLGFADIPATMEVE